MILIEITNINEIVRRERGLIAAKLGPYVKDVEGEVEQGVIEELKSAFAERGIEAKIAFIPFRLAKHHTIILTP